MLRYAPSQKVLIGVAGILALTCAPANGTPADDAMIANLLRDSYPNREADLHPTEPVVSIDGHFWRVVAIDGTKATVERNGARQSADVRKAIIRPAESFSAGKIAISEPDAEKTYSGISYRVELKPTTDLDNVLCALVASDTTLVVGDTEPREQTYFESVGKLKAGRRKPVLFEIKSADLPHQGRLRSNLTLYMLVFSGGQEIESSQSPDIARQVRNHAFLAHIRHLNAYEQANGNGSSAAQVDFQLLPYFGEGGAPTNLPQSTTAQIRLETDGSVKSVQLPPELSPDVAKHITTAVRGWLFLPELRDGTPVRSTLEVTIPLRGNDSDKAPPAGLPSATNTP
ncbi:MAG TPA: hypothetical protein VHD32_05020 [Candidatus Didemnitutus sp.]|nr:hypothetical protein [Candidatus Didemnitutus sp.]